DHRRGTSRVPVGGGGRPADRADVRSGQEEAVLALRDRHGDRHRGAVDDPHGRAVHLLAAPGQRHPQQRLVELLHRPGGDARQLPGGALQHLVRLGPAGRLLPQLRGHHDPDRAVRPGLRGLRGVRPGVDPVPRTELAVHRHLRPADRAAADGAGAAAAPVQPGPGLRRQHAAPAARAHRRAALRDRVVRPRLLLAADRDLPAPQLHLRAAGRADGGGAHGRREPLPDLPADRAAAHRAGAGVVRHLPVPVGVERPAGGAHLRRRQSAGGTADGEAGRAGRHPWRGVPAPDVRGLRLDRRPGDHLPGAAALLRARSAGRWPQGL
ncbi:MAG: Alpha-glucoside transport system permease protein AglG, partial [uncultured Frankineae bacterium]